MKIAIFSDAHGNVEAFNKFLEVVHTEKVEVILNLGDFVRGKDPDKIMDYIMNDSRFYSIYGNHDEAYCNEFEDSGKNLDNKYIKWIKSLKKNNIIEVGGKKIYITHSRPCSNKLAPLLYNDKLFNDFIDDYPNEVDLICFGHTHIQLFIESFYGKKILNPGSLGLAIDGKINFAIVEFVDDSFSYKFYKI